MHRSAAARRRRAPAARLHGPALERAHEAVRRRVATAVEQQRLREHRVDRVERERPLLAAARRRRCARAARPRATMRSSRSCGGSAAAARAPARQQRARALQRRARRGQSPQRAPPVAVAGGRARPSASRSSSLAPNSGLRKARASDRPMRRRDERVEHARSGPAPRASRPASCPRPPSGRRAARSSAARDQAQRLALAAEHEDARRRACRRRASARSRPRPTAAASRSRSTSSGSSRGVVRRVAPDRRAFGVRPARRAGRRGCRGSARHAAPATRADLGRVRAKAVERALGLGRAEHAVDRGDHRRARCGACGRRPGRCRSRPSRTKRAAASKTRGSARRKR